MKRPPPLDEEAREAAIRERELNLLLDAGPGTGKTTVLVRRLVQLVAPDDTRLPIDIGRIAAVTFTRRAAGELRSRVRGTLIGLLASPDTKCERRELLRKAISGLDTAYIGTIHSFADRLLRMRPVQARLSPAYEIVEDESMLIDETFHRLLHAVQQGTLEAELADTPAAARAMATSQVLQGAIAAGVRVETRETDHYNYYGLDALVEGFIRHRDLPPIDPDVVQLDLPKLRSHMREFLTLARQATKDSTFTRWVQLMARRIERLLSIDDPLRHCGELAIPVYGRRRGSSRPKKGDGCGGDGAVWGVWKALDEGGKHRNESDTPLGDDLTRPLFGWLASQLVRASPAVLALYDRVKAQHGALDQIDLLLQLRELLRRDVVSRAFYQGLFDHILIDEFQDTDPLQAEILLYLCEREPRAASWEEVEVASGRITLVGDPKQSIYRFRRADIEMYERVRSKIAQNGLELELTSNFRSSPSLVSWLNDRFVHVLGTDPKGRQFDRVTGRVFHRDLAPGRDARHEGEKVPPCVHVVPFELAEGADVSAGSYRDLEAEVLPRYLRWLVGGSDATIVDPVGGQLRRVQYGDICVLSLVTTELPRLFRQLDQQRIPYAASGGTLFLRDPLHRQFLLGLRALADPDDGIAQAALYRPPFFAVDLRDLVAGRAESSNPKGATPFEEVRAFVRHRRQRRFERSVGTTARDLLEGTGFARSIALGPNGAQRLARLRELCHLLETVAAEEGLDYDAATARLREWIDRPAQIDAPRPVDGIAVQVLTVHQAKGLEFPVVVLWDGQAALLGRQSKPPWHISRDRASWAIVLDGLEVSQPTGTNLAQVEKEYRDEERRRLVYVAATRARDLLVIPKAGQPTEKLVCGALLGSDAAMDGAVFELECYVQGTGAPWAATDVPLASEPADGTALAEAVSDHWSEQLTAAARPRYRSVAVSVQAKGAVADETAEAFPPKTREGRFGTLFGMVVHRAIGLALTTGATAEIAVARAGGAEVGGLFGEATNDVRRALAILESEGIVGPGRTVRIEYPIAGHAEDGALLLGSIDLVAAGGGHMWVIDFKTDQPPDGDVAMTMPGYVEQVRSYGRLLCEAGLALKPPRTGLLFTAADAVHWV